MSSKVTPLMQALAEVEAKQLGNLPSAEWDAYQRCVDILTSLLPTEREFAQDCFIEGILDDSTFTDFFNQYNNEK